MSTKRPRRGRMIPVVVATFYIGGAAGWWLHARLSRDPAAFQPVVKPTVAAPADPAARPSSGVAESKAAATDSTADSRVAATDSTAAEPAERPDKELIWRPDPIVELSHRNLRLPIDNADVERMKNSFAERRGGDTRGHEAVDILAPRRTPIHAVEGGTVAKLFYSKAGGTTVYQFDPSQHFCYYYAHLDSYASGLHEGQSVSAGDLLGYVGTSGNAPPDTPHLHFAIFELTPEKKWWDGRAIDPYPVFKRAG